MKEHILGLQKLIGQVQHIVDEAGDPDAFDAARWVAEWIEQPLPALANAKPVDYIGTVEGQNLVAGILDRMQSGAYA